MIEIIGNILIPQVNAMMVAILVMFTLVLLGSVVQGEQQIQIQIQKSGCHGHDDDSLEQAKLDSVISILTSDDHGKYKENARVILEQVCSIPHLGVECTTPRGARFYTCLFDVEATFQLIANKSLTAARVYAIFNPVNPVEKREVYCDMETEGGGWMVFQRRVSNDVNFNRGWAEYAAGFGDLTGNLWLGNELLHRLTYYRPQELRVELQNWQNVTAYAKYQEFRVNSQSDKYRLFVSGYSGTAGDSLEYHNGSNFCTKDRDYDISDPSNCAQELAGAWWFKDCGNSSLNGLFYKTATKPHGVSWDSFGGESNSNKISEMKIRPQ